MQTKCVKIQKLQHADRLIIKLYELLLSTVQNQYQFIFTAVTSMFERVLQSKVNTHEKFHLI